MTDWTMEHAIRYFASLPAMRIGVALAAVLGDLLWAFNVLCNFMGS